MYMVEVDCLNTFNHHPLLDQIESNRKKVIILSGNEGGDIRHVKKFMLQLKENNVQFKSKRVTCNVLPQTAIFQQSVRYDGSLVVIIFPSVYNSKEEYLQKLLGKIQEKQFRNELKIVPVAFNEGIAICDKFQMLQPLRLGEYECWWPLLKPIFGRSAGEVHSIVIQMVNFDKELAEFKSLLTSLKQCLKSADQNVQILGCEYAHEHLNIYDLLNLHGSTNSMLKMNRYPSDPLLRIPTHSSRRSEDAKKIQSKPRRKFVIRDTSSFSKGFNKRMITKPFPYGKQTHVYIIYNHEKDTMTKVALLKRLLSILGYKCMTIQDIPPGENVLPMALEMPASSVAVIVVDIHLLEHIELNAATLAYHNFLDGKIKFIPMFFKNVKGAKTSTSWKDNILETSIDMNNHHSKWIDKLCKVLDSPFDIKQGVTVETHHTKGNNAQLTRIKTLINDMSCKLQELRPPSKRYALSTLIDDKEFRRFLKQTYSPKEMSFCFSDPSLPTQMSEGSKADWALQSCASFDRRSVSTNYGSIESLFRHSDDLPNSGSKADWALQSCASFDRRSVSTNYGSIESLFRHSDDLPNSVESNYAVQSSSQDIASVSRGRFSEKESRAACMTRQYTDCDSRLASTNTGSIENLFRHTSHSDELSYSEDKRFPLLQHGITLHETIPKCPCHSHYLAAYFPGSATSYNQSERTSTSRDVNGSSLEVIQETAFRQNDPSDNESETSTHTSIRSGFIHGHDEDINRRTKIIGYQACQAAKIMAGVALVTLFIYTYGVMLDIMSTSVGILTDRKLRGDPVTLMMLGILTTMISGSSTFSLSVTIGAVTSGVITTNDAIPCVLASNVGTSVHNIMRHILRRRNFSSDELKRHFAAVAVPDRIYIVVVVWAFALEILFETSSKPMTFLSGVAENTSSLFGFTISPLSDSVLQNVCVFTGRNNTALLKKADVPVEQTEHYACVVRAFFKDIETDYVTFIGYAIAVISTIVLRCIFYAFSCFIEKTISLERPVMCSEFPSLGHAFILTFVSQNSTRLNWIYSERYVNNDVKWTSLKLVCIGANIGNIVTGLLTFLLATQNSKAVLEIVICNVLFNIFAAGIVALFQNFWTKYFFDKLVTKAWFAPIYIVVLLFLPLIFILIQIHGTPTSVLVSMIIISTVVLLWTIYELLKAAFNFIIPCNSPNRCAFIPNFTYRRTY